MGLVWFADIVKSANQTDQIQHCHAFVLFLFSSHTFADLTVVCSVVCGGTYFVLNTLF